MASQDRQNPSAPYAVAEANQTPQTAAPSTVPAVLRAAADLIEPRGRWTKEASARDRQGNDLESELDEAAVCWCAGGAIWRVAATPVRACLAARALERLVGGEIPEWNDRQSRTKAQVLAALRKAADLAEAGKRCPFVRTPKEAPQ